MGDKMRKFTEAVEPNVHLRAHVLWGLSAEQGGVIPMDILKCLEDPDQNIDTLNLLRRLKAGLEDGSINFACPDKIQELSAGFKDACEKAGIELDK